MLDRVAQFLAHDLTRDQVNAVVRVGWRLVLVGFILWACGMLTAFGTPGLARAADIDKRISDATKPIAERLDKLETTVATQVETSNALMLELTEKSLIEMNRRRCSSTTITERDYWQGEMNKLKVRYRTYSSGQAYEQRLCSDL